MNNSDVNYIINLIDKAGFEAYEVGGCVRDYIMSRPCNDIDITTSATPTETEKLLADNGIRFYETGIKHGTVTAVLNSDSYEITTFRNDGEYADFRHPSEVTFVTELSDDLARRDFTINAIAYNEKRGFIDPFNGRQDIENRIIRTVGNPDKRFNEDALRIMRAIRFASVLDFEIEQETKASIHKNRELLLNVSAERLFSELTKLLMGKNVFRILTEYKDVIGVIIPEVIPCFGYHQNTKWHIYDVWTHICKSVEQAPFDKTIRVIMLLHDLGKPFSNQIDENGTDHFKGHQKVSADIAKPVLMRFKVSGELFNRAMSVIPIHDIDIAPNRKNVKKWLSKLGEQTFRDLLEVRRADRLAQNLELTYMDSEKMDEILAILDDVIIQGDPVSVKDLDINGNDLIELGFKGRQIGEMLNELLELVLNEKIDNKKEKLVAYSMSKL